MKRIQVHERPRLLYQLARTLNLPDRSAIGFTSKTLRAAIIAATWV
jgi:hypothetical protein